MKQERKGLVAKLVRPIYTLFSHSIKSKSRRFTLALEINGEGNLFSHVLLANEKGNI